MREGGLPMNSAETVEGGGGGDTGRLTWLLPHDWLHPDPGYLLKYQIRFNASGGGRKNPPINDGNRWCHLRGFCPCLFVLYYHIMSFESMSHGFCEHDHAYVLLSVRARYPVSVCKEKVSFSGLKNGLQMQWMAVFHTCGQKEVLSNTKRVSAHKHRTSLM